MRDEAAEEAYSDYKSKAAKYAAGALGLAGGLVALTAGDPRVKAFGAAVGLVGTGIALGLSSAETRAAAEKAKEAGAADSTYLGEVDDPNFVGGGTDGRGGDGGEGGDQGRDLGDVDAETGCFVAGTLVSTESGLIPIEQVRTGSRVPTLNIEAQEESPQDVTRTFESQRTGVVVLQLPAEQIRCTPRHRFFSDSWTPAEEVKEGVKLLTRDGPCVPVLAVHREESTQPVFNLAITRTHNYFVGRSQLLVHNLKDEKPE